MKLYEIEGKTIQGGWLVIGTAWANNKAEALANFEAAKKGADNASTIYDDTSYREYRAVAPKPDK